jgi:hypothetical protein
LFAPGFTILLQPFDNSLRVFRQTHCVRKGTTMRIKCSLLGAALLSTAMFGETTALASDPVGVYAYVDKVVLEPSEGKPERIQIWGGFALAEGRGDTLLEGEGRLYVFQREARRGGDQPQGME